MSEIQVAASFINTSTSPLKGQPQEKQPPQAELPSVTTRQGIHISAESAYLFEIDKYLTHLNKAEQDKAVEFLSQSKDVLQNKAAEYFRQNQATLEQILGGKPPVLSKEFFPGRSENQLDMDFVLNEKTEIGVMPYAIDVFRLDGQRYFSPDRFGGRDSALRREFESLEAASGDVLGNQDRANLFGSVSNALINSENILMSFDDVLHFNYVLEKAEKAISFVNAPEELKSMLTDILNRGVAYQNEKQNYAINESKKFVNNERIGDIARENVRLGTAAQEYNHKLQDVLENTNKSILDSQGTLKKLLAENTDLIRFLPHKLDEAMAFYKSDYEKFERALNKDFSVPAVAKEPEVEWDILAVGSNHALKVIEEIQSYVSNNN